MVCLLPVTLQPVREGMTRTRQGSRQQAVAEQREGGTLSTPRISQGAKLIGFACLSRNADMQMPRPPLGACATWSGTPVRQLCLPCQGMQAATDSWHCVSVSMEALREHPGFASLPEVQDVVLTDSSAYR